MTRYFKKIIRQILDLFFTQIQSCCTCTSQGIHANICYYFYFSFYSLPLSLVSFIIIFKIFFSLSLFKISLITFNALHYFFISWLKNSSTSSCGHTKQRKKSFKNTNGKEQTNIDTQMLRERDLKKELKNEKWRTGKSQTKKIWRKGRRRRENEIIERRIIRWKQECIEGKSVSVFVLPEIYLPTGIRYLSRYG